MRFDPASSSGASRRLSLDSSRYRTFLGFHPPSELPDLSTRINTRVDGNGAGNDVETQIELSGERGSGGTEVALLDTLQSMQLGDETSGSSKAPESTRSLLNLQHWSDLSALIPEDGLDQSLDQKFEWKSAYQLVLAAMEHDVKIVDSKHVQYSELIGSGANMTVFKGTVNGNVVALKRIRPFVKGPGTQRDPKVALASLEMEIRVMSDVFLKGHENIAKLRAFTWETGKDGELLPVLVMDLAEPQFSTLEAFMQVVGLQDFADKAYLISDLVCGLAAIHEEKIIHGDLKPENILLFHRISDGVLNTKMPVIAKITDFGFCEDIYSDEPSSTNVAAGGTEYWNAPECMPEAPEEIKSYARRTQRDLYSCGLIMWYILSNKLPLGPYSGADWDENRRSLREAKISGEIAERCELWCRSNLQMVFAPIAKGDLADFRAELEEELDPLDFSGRMVVEEMKTDPEDAQQYMFDELLFRDEGKVAWFTKHPQINGWIQCGGYLPVMVPRVMSNMLRSASARLPASSAVPMCKIFPHRKPAKIYRRNDAVGMDGRTSRGRQGWEEYAARFRGTFASARKLQTLSPEMLSSLLAELHRNADGSHPSLDAILMLKGVYQSGYGVASDSSQAQRYMMKAIELTKGTAHVDELGSLSLGGYYASKWYESAPLEQWQELKWALQMLSREMGKPWTLETPSLSRIPTLSRELFETRLADALSVLEWKSQSRFFRISASAYLGHQMIKSGNRSDPILRKPENGEGVPEIRGPWVNTLLRDDPASFEALQESGALPTDLRLWNEDMDSVLYMFAGMSGETSREQVQKSMLQGWIQRAKAVNNLVRICAEHGLVKLLKHLIKKHNVDINRKLDSGWNPLQEVLEQGRLHHAVSLLACGADLNAVADKDFIRHISGDGHFNVIDFWAQLKQVHESMLWSNDPNLLLINHYRAISELFMDNENLDLDAQAYPNHEPPLQPASPVYFSISENTWSTFLALLRYGIDPSKPALGTLDTLQSSVVMIRPLFVATLLGPEYKHKFRTDLTDTPSLFHLAALGRQYFMPSRMWVYGNVEEIKAEPEAAKDDQGNNQRVVLELLWRNLSLEVDGRDSYGLTPFLLAVVQNDAPAADWFERHGANIRATALDGSTALHLSIASGSAEITGYVLKLAKDLLEEQDSLGQTALHFAVSQSNIQILTQILDLQPNLEAVDRLGRTACLTSLDHGQSGSFVSCVKAVCERLGRGTLHRLLNTRDEFGRNCYHVLPSLSDEILAQISEGLDFNFFDSFDETDEHDCSEWTPAHFAACGHFKRFDKLFTAQAINTKGYQGLTCLHLAYLSQRTDLAKDLIEKGAKQDIGDDFGRIPLDLLDPAKDPCSEAVFLDGMSFLFREKLLRKAQDLLPVSCIYRPLVIESGLPKSIFPKTYLPEFKELHVDEAHTIATALEAGQRVTQQLFPPPPPDQSKTKAPQRSCGQHGATKSLPAIKFWRKS